MGNGVNLRVKISENPVERQKRLARKREEEEFLKTLNCGKYGRGEKPQPEEYEMDDDEAERNLKNPFLPRYTPPSPITDATCCYTPPSPTTTPTKGAHTSPDPCSLSSSGGASSLTAQSGLVDRNSPEVMKTLSDSPKSLSASPKSPDETTPVLQQSCVVCQKLCMSKCSRCKTPYCGAACQEHDWPNHKLQCQKVGASQQDSSEPQGDLSEPRGDLSEPQGDQSELQGDLSGPLRIAESIDDEGFHITDGPDDSELEELQRFFQQVKQTDQVPPSQKEDPLPRSSSSDSTKETGSYSPSKHVTFAENPVQSAVGKGSHFSMDFETTVPLSEILSHFDQPSQPLVSIPLSSILPRQFNAVITSLLSCCRFSVIALSSETKQALRKIQEFGSMGPHTPVTSAQLTVRSQCGLRLEDGGFCRAEVVIVQMDDTVAVKRYDFGGKVVVPCSCLSLLPDELISIPCLRHMCATIGLFSEDSRESSEFLLSLVEGKPIQVNTKGTMSSKFKTDKKFHLCKIETADGRTDLTEVIKSSQFVSIHVTRSPEAMESTVQQDHTYKMVHFSSKVPVHQPPRGKVFEIFPTVVSNPSVIWAQIVHSNIGKLHQMQHDLNIQYGSAPSAPYVPTIGEICAAKFTDDQRYYRAEVLCVNNNGTVDVLYVDFGNRDTIMTTQLSNLKPVFLSLPKQALQFTLAGIAPCGGTWSDNAIAYLKDKIMNKRVPTQILSESPKVLSVVLHDPESPRQAINDSLVALGHAQHVTTETEPSKRPLLSLPGVSVSQQPGRQPSSQVSSQQPGRQPSSQGSSVQQYVPLKQNIPPLDEMALSSDGGREERSLQGGGYRRGEQSQDERSLQGGGYRRGEQSQDERLLQGGGYRRGEQSQDERLLQGGGYRRGEQSQDERSLQGGGYRRGSPGKQYVVQKDSPRLPVTPPLSPEEMSLPKSSQSAPWGSFGGKKNSPSQVTTPPSLTKAGLGRLPAQTSAESSGSQWQPSSQMFAASGTSTKPGILGSAPVSKPGMLGSLPKPGMLGISPLQPSSPSPKPGTQPSPMGGRKVPWGAFGGASSESGSTPAIDSASRNESTPAIDSASRNESTPAIDSASRNESTPAIDSASRNESTTAIDSASRNESTPAIDSASRNESTPAFERSSGAIPGVRKEFTRSLSQSESVSTGRERASKRRLENAKFPADATEVKAIVSYVEDPYQFWVQVLDEQALASLLECTERMNQSALVRHTNLQAGELCVCRFSEDGMFYRGRINTIMNSHAKVQFIDYGNTDSVELSEIYHIQDDLLVLPAQGVLCTLNQLVNPAGKNSPWKEETIEFVRSQLSNKIVTLIPVKCVGLLHIVDVRVPTDTGEKDFLQQMVESGHGQTFSMGGRAGGMQEVGQHGRHQKTGVRGRGDQSKGTRSGSDDDFHQRDKQKTSPFAGVRGMGDQSKGTRSGSDDDFSQKKSPFSKSPFARSQSSSGEVKGQQNERRPFQRGEAKSPFASPRGKDTVRKSPFSSLPSQSSTKNSPFSSLPSQASANESPFSSLPSQSSTKKSPFSSLPSQASANESPFSSLPSQSSTKRSPFSTPQNQSQSTRSPFSSLPSQSTPSSRLEPQPPMPTNQVTATPTKAPCASDLGIIKFPSDSDYNEVIVSELHHPQSIYVQIATMSSTESLNKLLTGLNTHLQSHPQTVPLSPPPTKGSLCCAKFSQDGCWYRAEVQQNLPRSCVVRFIDFGNMDTVQLCDVAPCPIEHLTTAAMTIECALNGIVPAPSPQTGFPSFIGGQTGWSDESILFLKEKCSNKRLLAKVVKNHGGILPEIDLIDTSSAEDVNMASELVKSGYAILQSSTEAASPISTRKRPLTPEGFKQAPARTTCPGGTPSLSSPGGTPSLSSPGGIPSLSSPRETPLLSIPPAQLPTSTLFPLVLTHVNDPSSFWVQHVEKQALESLETLMNRLQTTYSDPGKHKYFQPAVGAFCVAKYSDDLWYRCKVLVLRGDTARVQYIDFGNSENVSTDHLFALDQKFSSLPSTAVHCSLSGIKPVSQTGWTTKAIQHFTNLVMSGELQILSAQVTQADTTPVQIEIYLKDKSRVADSLVQTGHAVSPTSSVHEVKSQAISTPEVQSDVTTAPQAVPYLPIATATLPQAVPYLPIATATLPTTNEFQVMVTHTNSLTDLYFQVFNKQDIAALVRMMEEINRQCASSTRRFSQPPRIGELCLSQFTDGSWYRAQVLRQISQREYEIHFIDFGNKQTAVLEQMKTVVKEFLSLPAQAIRCGLYGVPVRQAIHLSPNDLEMFKEIVVDKPFTCKVLCPDPLLVDLRGADPSMSVRDELVQMEIFPRIEDLGITTLPMNRLPTTDTSVILVTEVADPGNFWLQVIDAKTLQEMEKLSQKVHDYCQSCSLLEDAPVLGQLCCAKFTEDRVWYRARVTEILDQSSFRVQFVDFGNSEVTSISNLRPFQREFSHIPSQAVHCCLVGYETSPTPHDKVIDHFKGLVGLGRVCKLVAIHRGVIGCYQTVVELVDTRGEDDVYIHKELMQ